MGNWERDGHLGERSQSIPCTDSKATEFRVGQVKTRPSTATHGSVQLYEPMHKLSESRCKERRHRALIGRENDDPIGFIISNILSAAGSI
jgi:hypothetical protein